MSLRNRAVDGSRRGAFCASASVSAALSLAALFIIDPAGPRAPAPTLPEKSLVVMDRPPDVPHDVSYDRILLTALTWLARHQYEDGSWGAAAFWKQCPERVCLGSGREANSPAVTAMATLAFWESGLLAPGGKAESLRSGAERGLEWLYEELYGPHSRHRCAGRCLYTHALATLVFARAYSVTWDPLHLHYARRSLEFLLHARTRGGGWRYVPDSGESDLYATGWAMAAVDACREIGLPVDPSVNPDVALWVESLTDPMDYRAGYRRRGDRGWRPEDGDVRFALHDTNTAVAMAVRMAVGQPASHPAVQGGGRRLASDLPHVTPDGSSIDFLYWFHGTRALARASAPDDPLWCHWHARVVRSLLARQLSFRDGCYEGSWDPSDRWGAEGGRVYATALNALTLATAERHRPPDDRKP